MALTAAQEAKLLAHAENTNNPHNSTASQAGITNTDNLPEGRINLYNVSSTDIVTPIADWFPDAVSEGYIISAGTTGMFISVSLYGSVGSGISYAWLGGQQYFYNDEADVIEIATADATNPRIDLVYLDLSGAGTDYSLSPIVATGTPAASPSAPATPTDCLALYEITVPANETSSANFTCTDKRVLISAVNENAAQAAADALTSEINAAASETAASASEIAAAASEGNAYSSEIAAALSETNAATYRDEAHQWSNRAEDFDFTDSDGNTGYSAYHWSKKAQAYTVTDDKYARVSGETVSDFLAANHFERNAITGIELGPLARIIG